MTVNRWIYTYSKATNKLVKAFSYDKHTGLKTFQSVLQSVTYYYDKYRLHINTWRRLILHKTMEKY